ncbi:MAG TPA: hypothetical protein VF721_08790 [Pyrinomonadaceae bacterium]|jgi:hypothetical protein
MEKGKRQNEEIERGDSLPVIDGELLAVSPGNAAQFSDEEETIVPGAPKKIIESRKPQLSKIEVPLTRDKGKSASQKSFLQYLILPFIFLTVSLFGGLRFGEMDNAFLFLRPPLVCLIFASILLLLFFRAGLIRLEGWFSESFSTVKNLANGLILLTLFAASVQVFNALLPEQGLPFWIFAFCFFWTLWNNIFAEFNTKRLLQSLGSLFGLAFVVKYLILAYLTAPTAGSWLQGILQNPTQEVFTWLLDLPKFAPATGYIQFFTLILYLIGLFLIKPQMHSETPSSEAISLKRN